MNAHICAWYIRAALAFLAARMVVWTPEQKREARRLPALDRYEREIDHAWLNDNPESLREALRLYCKTLLQEGRPHA